MLPCADLLCQYSKATLPGTVSKLLLGYLDNFYDDDDPLSTTMVVEHCLSKIIHLEDIYIVPCCH